MNLPHLPKSVALLLLDDISDACVVFDRVSGTVIWHNRAWNRFEQLLGSPQGGSSESLQTVMEKQLATTAIAAPDVPSREHVTWNISGLPTFETPLVLRPYEYEGQPLVAVLVQWPRPLAELADEATVRRQRDPLTGLSGRDAIQAHIDLQNATSPRAAFALLFVDLDGFKSINDRWGHVAGDQVLAEVSRRLAGAIRSGDLIVRYGGDEFVVVVQGIHSHDDLSPVVTRLRQAAEAPIEIDGAQAQISASLGVALSNEPWESVADLVAMADHRMYAEKQRTGPTPITERSSL